MIKKKKSCTLLYTSKIYFFFIHIYEILYPWEFLLVKHYFFINSYLITICFSVKMILQV